MGLMVGYSMNVFYEYKTSMTMPHKIQKKLRKPLGCSAETAESAS
jgi:hypothetical protein